MQDVSNVQSAHLEEIDSETYSAGLFLGKQRVIREY
jgi:hypothetical protein